MVENQEKEKEKKGTGTMWFTIKALGRTAVYGCLLVVGLLVLAYWLGGHPFRKTEKTPAETVVTQNVNVPAVAPVVTPATAEKVEEPPVSKTEEAKPSAPVAPSLDDQKIVVKMRVRVTMP